MPLADPRRFLADLFRATVRAADPQLAQRNIITCAEASAGRDGQWLMTAGLVLVRQRPGSAKGVMFATIEDETGVVNIVIWPSLFEKHRRIVLGASLLAVHGKVQREGDVVHLIARQLLDLSTDLASIGSRDAAFPLPAGRGDEIPACGPGGDPRHSNAPDLAVGTIKVRSRNFQ